jgi:hypothetical protein
MWQEEKNLYERHAEWGEARMHVVSPEPVLPR